MNPSGRERPKRRRLWRKHYVLPAEHGVWTWWLGPLLVGLAAGSCPGWDSALLLFAALTSFFVHQPAAIAVKALAGRRPRTDLAPALVWVAIHGTVALLAVAALVWRGHTRFVALAAVGLPFFAFHLWLIYRKAERRQMAVEVIGAGVLALWAPAAYWIAGGTRYPEPWVLWLLCWIQNASAIANVYLRLDQRRWPEVPSMADRIRSGRRTLAFHALGLAAAVAFAAADQAPWLVLLPFAYLLVDAIDSVVRPMIGARPLQIGLRQLAATTLFVALMVTAYLL